MDAKYAAHPHATLLQMIKEYGHLHASAVFAQVLDGRVKDDWSVDLSGSANEQRAQQVLAVIADRLAGLGGEPTREGPAGGGGR